MGLAKKPPREGPKIEPRLQTRGMTENALGCSSFSVTISATIVRMIPTTCVSQAHQNVSMLLPFPLKAPAMDLATIAIGRLLDMPQRRLAIMVHVNPSRIDGLRPKLSDALPHRMAVRHCEREKTPETSPDHFPMSLFRTPKLSIIAG